MSTALSPAVLHCWTAYEQTYALERGKGASIEDSYENGKMAYRQAMPCLSDQASIRDFVACVTHGMVLRLIPNQDGGKLLYAANVAAGFLRNDLKMDEKIAAQSPRKNAGTSVSSSESVAA